MPLRLRQPFLALALLTLLGSVALALLADGARGGGARVTASYPFTVHIVKVNGGDGSVKGWNTEGDPDPLIIDCPAVNCTAQLAHSDSTGGYFRAYPAAGSTFEWGDWCEDYYGDDVCGPILALGPRDITVTFTGSGDTEPPPPPPPDKTAPQTSFISKPAKVLRRARLPVSVRFAFASNEPSSTFQCSLDGRAFAPCTSPKILSVRAGRHTFRVRATDKAGNRDTTPAAHSFQVIRRN